MGKRIVIMARIEEVPILGQFTIDSYGRDTVDFQAYKPTKYNGGFLVLLQTEKAAVDAIIFPKKLTEEMKVITIRIITNMFALRPLLNKLEGYVDDATGLTVTKKGFGISEVRIAINRDDQEQLDSALKYLEEIISDNMAALTAVGYSAGELTTLTTLHGQLNSDNAAQKAKLAERRLLVVNNLGVINTLGLTLKGVWKDGKLMYKISTPQKLPDYTNSRLIKLIRQEQLRTKVEGVITNISGHGLNRVKVKATPVLGGRTKTVYTNTEGNYLLKGLKAGSYVLTITLDGKTPIVANVEVVTGETVVVNFQMQNA